jgi:hypothetical protein
MTHKDAINLLDARKAGAPITIERVVQALRLTGDIAPYVEPVRHAVVCAWGFDSDYGNAEQKRYPGTSRVDGKL